MPKPVLRILPLFVALFLLASCSPSETDKSSELTQVAKEEETNSDEIIHISGEGSYVSEPFQLEGPGGLHVYWRHESSSFVLIMVNTNEALASAPLGEVTFTVDKQPSEFVEGSPYDAPFEYVPGEYVFKIEADGPWEVWAKVKPLEGE